MHIILASPRGFCAGVNIAVKALNAALQQFDEPIYVYHEIVHNTWVVDHFRKKGVRFVNSIEEVPDGSRLMFSAHGVAPAIRQEAAKRNIETIDATCQLVNKVHQLAIRYAKEGYKIILLGHRGHDEVVGVMSEAPDVICVVEDEEELRSLKFRPDERLVYLTQTTLSVIETARMIELLRKRFPQIVGLSSNICYATQSRQEAIRKLSSGVDVVLVIGSRSSSNSRRLAELAESLGICSYLVDGPDDISAGLFRGDETVLVTAGASAPEEIVQECVAVLKKRFGASVEESASGL